MSRSSQKLQYDDHNRNLKWSTKGEEDFVLQHIPIKPSWAHLKIAIKLRPVLNRSIPKTKQISTLVALK